MLPGVFQLMLGQLKAGLFFKFPQRGLDGRF